MEEGKKLEIVLMDLDAEPRPSDSDHQKPFPRDVTSPGPEQAHGVIESAKPLKPSELVPERTVQVPHPSGGAYMVAEGFASEPIKDMTSNVTHVREEKKPEPRTGWIQMDSLLFRQDWKQEEIDWGWRLDRKLNEQIGRILSDGRTYRVKVQPRQKAQDVAPDHFRWRIGALVLLENRMEAKVGDFVVDGPGGISALHGCYEVRLPVMRGENLTWVCGPGAADFPWVEQWTFVRERFRFPGGEEVTAWRRVS